jgi:hypothetical protein
VSELVTKGTRRRMFRGIQRRESPSPQPQELQAAPVGMSAGLAPSAPGVSAPLEGTPIFPGNALADALHGRIDGEEYARQLVANARQRIAQQDELERRRNK